MDGPDDLLEEPLFLDGSFIRRWDEFARLARPDDVGSRRLLGRTPDRGSPARHGGVLTPRMPGPFGRVTERAPD